MRANLEKQGQSGDYRPMPTLFRLLVAIAFFAGLAFAGMFALSVMVQPTEREVTVRIPARDLLPDARA
ncbi:histidine kinase [Pelagibacterium lacus]|uniref:histidine kinase n=1 Tax=Pelagibacterium lacus TaxID=2282655 RepID=UPI003F6DF976